MPPRERMVAASPWPTIPGWSPWCALRPDEVAVRWRLPRGTPVLFAKPAGLHCRVYVPTVWHEAVKPLFDMTWLKRIAGPTELDLRVFILRCAMRLPITAAAHALLATQPEAHWTLADAVEPLPLGWWEW